MIKIQSPACLSRIQTINDIDDSFVFCVVTEGSEFSHDPKLFLDQKGDMHEKYLVHVKADGFVQLARREDLYTYLGKHPSTSVYPLEARLITETSFFQYPRTVGGVTYPDGFCRCFLTYKKSGFTVGIFYTVRAFNVTGPKYGIAQPGGQAYLLKGNNRADIYRINMSGFGGYFPSSLDAINHFNDVAQELFTFTRIQRDVLLTRKDYDWINVNPRFVTDYDVTRLPNPRNFLHFSEDKWIPGSQFHDLPYVINHLRQSAFMDAANKIQRFNDNLIPTILEIFKMYIGIIEGNWTLAESIPSSLQELWLAYRYVYSTNKADWEQAVSFIKWTGIFNFKDTMTFRGVHSDEGITCRCKLTVRNSFLGAAKYAWSVLYTYGMQPNFYTFWDMTPFSFIVDWFIPVGDMVALIDKTNNLFDNYQCVSCVYSLSYLEELKSRSVNIHFNVFDRWVEYRFPPVEFAYLYEEKTCTKKTFLKRTLDVVSLLTG